MNQLIIQPKHITHAKYDYSVTQKNIMTHIISHLQDKMSITDQTLFNEEIIDIPLKELDKNKNYSHILTEAKEMMNKKIEYEIKRENGKETEIITSMISTVLHEKGSPNVQFLIPSYAVPVFCYIGDGFTKFRKLIMLTLGSVYSKNIYELCCDWEDKGGFKMKIDTFRREVNIPETYKNSNIKQRVLEPSKKELKKHADIYFEYSLDKSKGSRSFDLINFKIISKRKHAAQSEAERDQAVRSMYQEVFTFIQNLIPDQARAAVDHINASDRLDECYDRITRLDDDYVSGKKDRMDLIRLIKHIFKNDFDYVFK